MPIVLEIEVAPVVEIELIIQEPIEIVAKSANWEISPEGRGIVSMTGDGEGNVDVLFTDATTETIDLATTMLDGKEDIDPNILRDGDTINCGIFQP